LNNQTWSFKMAFVFGPVEFLSPSVKKFIDLLIETKHISSNINYVALFDSADKHLGIRDREQEMVRAIAGMAICSTDNVEILTFHGSFLRAHGIEISGAQISRNYTLLVA